MMMKLIFNPAFNIFCIMVGFVMYITNVYVLRNRKARLPYKIFLTSLIPGLNITLVLMQFCFIVPTFINLPFKVINNLKVSRAVTKLGYSTRKTITNRLPKKA